MNCSSDKNVEVVCWTFDIGYLQGKKICPRKQTKYKSPTPELLCLLNSQHYGTTIDRLQRRDNNTFCLCRTEMTSYCENISKTLEGLRNWAQNREDDWELPDVDLTGSVAIGKAPFYSSLLMDTSPLFLT